MYKLIKSVTLGASAFICAACSISQQAVTTPTPSMPSLAKHALTGELDGGVYQAPIGVPPQGALLVDVPQPSQDWAYTPMTDTLKQRSTKVMFGPGFYDKNIYRLTVEPLASHQTFYTQARHILESLTSQFASSTPIKLYEKYSVRGGHSALFAVYQQNVNQGEVLTQIIYIIKHYQYIKVFWITATNKGKVHAVTGENRFDVIKQRWMPGLNFIDSVKIT